MSSTFGFRWRVESTMLPQHAVAYAHEDGILSPEAIDLWSTFLTGNPSPWTPERARLFKEITNSPYTLRVMGQCDEGNYIVSVIFDRPMNQVDQTWVAPLDFYQGRGFTRTESEPPKRAAIQHPLIYVMKHPGFRALKIGITRSLSQGRISEHVSRGWSCEKTFEFESVKDARKVEREVLQTFWAKGYTSPVTPADMPQGGSTEVFRLRDVSVAQMAKEIESHMDGVIDA